MDIDDIEDDKLDLKWKYFTVIGFIKSILRRYSHEYRELADKFIANIDNAIPHESTRRQISIGFKKQRKFKKIRRMDYIRYHSAF